MTRAFRPILWRVVKVGWKLLRDVLISFLGLVVAACLTVLVSYSYWNDPEQSVWNNTFSRVEFFWPLLVVVAVALGATLGAISVSTNKIEKAENQLADKRQKELLNKLGDIDPTESLRAIQSSIDQLTAEIRDERQRRNQHGGLITRLLRRLW